MKGKKVTIREIAERLHMGKTTVALALADKYGVSEETKAKIVLTAYEMGYDFSKLNKKKNRITIVLANKSFLMTEFWADIIKGVEMEASTQGYVTEIIALDKSNSVETYPLSFLRNNSAGLIFVDSSFDQNYEVLSRLNIPVVLLDPRSYMGTDLTLIRADNYLGGYMACDYLWAHGHRKLCYIGNISHGNSVRSRWLGFSDRFTQLSKGIAGCSLLSLTDADKRNEDYMYNHVTVLETFKKKSLPTGIFCCNDMVALQTMAALKEEFGLKAPDDYSIIGFDNIMHGKTSDPPLTTININCEEMGRMSVMLLKEEIDSKSLQKKNIQIYGTLVERGSVGTVER